MDLFSSPDTYLDQCFYLSLRELILLLIVVYQLGYYFGKKRIFSIDLAEATQNSYPVLCLPCSQNPNQHHAPFEKHDERVQHSLKLIRDSFQECSTLPATIDSQSGTVHSQKISPAKSEEEITRDFLSEKITVQGKKIQSRGIFHMNLEKAENPKFIRKIQKHQVITDYEVQSNDSSQSQLIPFGSKKLFEFTDESSILEISTYENIRLQKFPIIEKKLIKTHEFAQFENKNEVNIPMSASLCENGKFSKFFKNAKKIGEGAFGVVYSAKNIFEGKNYAVKKLFIKSSGLAKDKIDVILNESIKEVNIISQYSHPNIIRFYTCWLQIANLNESMIFNKLNFKEQSQSDYSDLQSSREMNFKKKKSTEECLEVSYISSQANSGFAFEGESAKNITTSFRKSINSQVQECQVLSVIENQSSITCQKQQNPPSNYVPVFALYIQMQLCSEGSLDTYLHRRKSINRSFAFIVINQLLHGAEYLHLNGLVHRDLKPGNILINKKQMLIKIGDFGLSTRLNDDIQYGKIGTPSYIAPQIMEKRPIRKEQLHLIDVYSIGVIFYELLNLFSLGTKHQKLQKINKLKQGKVDLPGEFGLQKKLIRFMTKSTNRLSIRQIFQRKEYLQLSESVKQHLEIQESWDNVEGLQNE